MIRGRRLLKLQTWWFARAPATLLQNAPVAAVAFSVTSGVAVKSQEDDTKKTFTVSYLVHSCGLTPEVAESISKKVILEDSGNPDSVLKLLKSHGFTDFQVSKIVRNHPGLLLIHAEKTLLPKLELLRSKCDSNSEFTEIVSKVPRILAKGLHTSINPYCDFFKHILRNDDEGSMEFHHSLPQGILKNVVYNLSVLRKLGVPQHSLSRLFVYHYKSFGRIERFEESVKKVIEMGFNPTIGTFVYALIVVHELSDKTMELKVAAYKRLGFSESEIWTAFKKWPFCLKMSEEKLSRIFETLMRFSLSEQDVRAIIRSYPSCVSMSEQKISKMVEALLNIGFTRDEVTQIFKSQPSCIGNSVEKLIEKAEFIVKMDWPLKSIAKQPAVLSLSLEKRIIPRCNVITYLKSKGIINGKVSISSVLKTTEKVFLDMFVLKYMELVPELMDIFNSKKGN